MGFPKQFLFVHEGATYEAVLADSKDAPAATGVCRLCQQPLGARNFYVIASPCLFHVHADCAMAASGGGQQHYYPPPPPPSPFGWPRPPMPNWSYANPAQYCSPPYYPPPPFYPPQVMYSFPPPAYHYQPPSPFPSPSPPPSPPRRRGLSAVTGIIKTAAEVACKAILFDGEL